VELLLETFRGRTGLPVQSTTLQQGIGRIVHSEAQTAAYFEIILDKLQASGRLNYHDFVSLGRVLKTSDLACIWLPAQAADLILTDAITHLEEENDKSRDERPYSRKFKFMLLMLGGLLRHRKARRTFITPGSASAHSLMDGFSEAVTKIEKLRDRQLRYAERSTGRERRKLEASARRLVLNAEVLEELKNMILKKGSDPNVLTKIENIEDDDDA
jgi:hypothetical protein